MEYPDRVFYHENRIEDCLGCFGLQPLQQVVERSSLDVIAIDTVQRRSRSRTPKQHLQEAIGADEVVVADEAEFKELFADCEVGAMPPFGNLYDMGVYISEQLVEDDEIAFNAGSHSELVKMSYRDFANLVTPQVVALT